jgi:hypothetical protein
MNGPKMILENMRRARVERILSTPPSGLLVSRGFRRFLCVIAVVFSYIYLFTLLLPTSVIWGEITGGEKVLTVHELSDNQRFLITVATFIAWAGVLAPVILLATYLFLRNSMRRVTSLPDEFLDEREIANRDWAFKTGYLVIRRVGFVIAGIFLVLKIFAFNPSWDLDADGNRIRTGIEATLFQFDQYLASLTTSGAINFYFNTIALLTYVAFTFPLTLLAWRESKFSDSIPAPVSLAPLEGAAKIARRYFIMAGSVGSIFVGFILLMSVSFTIRPLGEFLLFSGAYFLFFILAVPYAMFVYIWASIKTVEVLKAAKQNNYNQGKYATSAIGALIFFVITQLLGVSIVVLFSQIGNSGRDNPLLLLICFGFAMIPTQAMSFVFIRRLGKGEKAA